jgi:hypothetical protein
MMLKNLVKIACYHGSVGVSYVLPVSDKGVPVQIIFSLISTRYKIRMY